MLCSLLNTYFVLMTLNTVQFMFSAALPARTVYSKLFLQITMAQIHLNALAALSIEGELIGNVSDFSEGVTDHFTALNDGCEKSQRD